LIFKENNCGLSLILFNSLLLFTFNSLAILQSISGYKLIQFNSFLVVSTSRLNLDRQSDDSIERPAGGPDGHFVPGRCGLRPRRGQTGLRNPVASPSAYRSGQAP